MTQRDAARHSQPSDVVLAGEAVRLRPVQAEDAARLREILAEPDVARWWTNPSPDAAAADWLAEFGQATFIIEHAGAVVGSIQYSEVDDEEYRSAGIDIFLASAYHGRGLGTDAIRTLARYLFQVRGHHRLTIDPAAANARAIHVYSKVGFRPVGVMRAYERGRDGTWHDGLLMDLLVEEFVWA